MSATRQTNKPPGSQPVTSVRKRPGPQPKPIVEFPQPLDDRWEEPTTFRDALALHIKRHRYMLAALEGRDAPTRAL